EAGPVTGEFAGDGVRIEGPNQLLREALGRSGRNFRLKFHDEFQLQSTFGGRVVDVKLGRPSPFLTERLKIHQFAEVPGNAIAEKFPESPIAFREEEAGIAVELLEILFRPTIAGNPEATLRGSDVLIEQGFEAKGEAEKKIVGVNRGTENEAIPLG